ncbi:unnamed protein product [Cyprideis torosa]|uniref:Uncharacterized protein n=1 Tax=Cyprideis torosa TaxID=163714 RepID=A0A7R8ZKM6_9CRUS|nr:unnamed protein product [Cyprideis torosa]CAG0884766.1 unnamed protein product [Cyprideis torosa]
MHKYVKVQLPDLRVIDVMVDFSIKTFGAVSNLCKRLGINHAEELSFQKPLTSDDLAYNYREDPRRRPVKVKRLDTNEFVVSHSNGSANPRKPANPGTPNQSFGYSPYNTLNGTLHNASFDAADSFNQDSFAHSDASIKDVKGGLIHPRTLNEKARMNKSWLDSSLSLMEQGFKEWDSLSLKFKFYSFYDLNPKTDAIRINQIYEQAKWQILNEEIDCSEDEALMFAALQFQVRESRFWPVANDVTDFGGEDEIDAALTELQISLEGSNMNGALRGMSKVPVLEDELRFMKQKKFVLKSFKPYNFVCKDTILYIHKGSTDGEPEYSIQLKGCEVTPDVSVSQKKYCIKLEVPSEDGMQEMWIRCNNEEQYARWMAACRLGSKGKSLADPTYDPEVKSILSFLSMQKPSPAPAITSNDMEIDPEEYLPLKFLKKGRNRLSQRILEAHANVKDMNNIQAKMNYIQAWQRLPLYGISLFIVRFDDAKKDELLGVGFNKLVKLDSQTAHHLKTWRLSSMKSWDINWEVKKMRIHFEKEQENLIFSIASADCKVFHEFLGGYIFLSMRSKDANQTLNEELFHKLTGGWV